MTARTRRTVRSAGLVAVAATAAFSLTACQDGGGKEDDAGSSSSSAVSKDSQTKDSPSKASQTNGSGSTGSTSSGSTGSGSGSSGAKSGNGGSSTAGGTTQAEAAGVKRTACTVGKVSVGLKETGGSAPVILLKATNNGSTRCDLYGYPFVGYPDAQAPIAVGGGKPQAVVSLEPGESAYASLGLEKGDGGNMHREKHLTVQLANRDQHGTGATATLTAPGAGLAISDNSTVSYWNTTPESAMQ
ncbi:DUF4232 domain-containing protein [Streptomyces smyrnaeus]|uniref:DUF4232 domain-containing protein n=1 Tax=Streptomyces smyrnaeus TaxID=1387713 RepID=UPI0036C653E4